MPKKTPLQIAVAELDKEWSVYVRYSAADLRGEARCWTCGRADHPRNLHCGHFASRRHLATRWSQENTRPQCRACNLYHQGQQYIFGTKLNAVRPGLADDILHRAKQSTKLDRDRLRERARFLAQRNARLVETVDARYEAHHPPDHPTVAAIKTHRARRRK